MHRFVEPLEGRQLFASVPTGFTDTTLVTGLSEPTAMELAPDGRIFVTQQTGELRVVKNGSLLSTPALTLGVDSAGERGLLGVTVDPNFANNGFVYLYYTTTSGGTHNRVSRFTVSGDTIDPATELVLLNLDPLTTATNHNGGGLHFGPDGKLYISVGENADGTNSQTLTNLLGKILRINADGSIPTDNPFFNTATGQNRAIWAIGLRNPFTFNFDPDTGRLLINDVGASTFEEVDEGIAGANYGWPTTEGPTANPAFQTPIYFYGHDEGIAIVGAAFYSPSTNTFGSEFEGDYFFADLGAGFIRRLEGTNLNTFSTFATGLSAPVDLDVTPDGNLLYLQRGGGGTIGEISHTPEAPVARIIAPLAGTRYTAGQRMHFAGRARDSAGHALLPSAFNWSVDFVDSNGSVTNLTTASGVRAGSVLIPRDQNTDIGGHYRITMTVTDSNGQTTTVTRDKFPRLVSITVLSNIPGATFTLNGVTQPSLTTFQVIAGTRVEIGAFAPPDTATETFEFRHWASGQRTPTRILTPVERRTPKMIFAALPLPALGSLNLLDDDLRDG